MDFDTRRSFIKLRDIASQDRGSDDIFAMICHYIAKYVYKLYGMNYINRWIKDHKGMSFFDLFTAPDVAYTNLVIHGNYQVWEQVIKISKTDDKKREKYKPKTKNRIKLPFEEQKSYKKMKGRFEEKGHKARYC